MFYKPSVGLTTDIRFRTDGPSVFTSATRTACRTRVVFIRFNSPRFVTIVRHETAHSGTKAGRKLRVAGRLRHRNNGMMSGRRWSLRSGEMADDKDAQSGGEKAKRRRRPFLLANQRIRGVYCVYAISGRGVGTYIIYTYGVVPKLCSLE